MDVGLVDLDLPVFANTADARCLKRQLDDLVDKIINQFTVIGSVDPLAHIQDTVQSRGRVTERLFLKDGEGLADQSADVQIRFVFNKPTDRSVNVPQNLLVNHCEPGSGHHVKQENYFPLISVGFSTCGQKVLGRLTVYLNDLAVSRQCEQFPQQFGRIDRPLGANVTSSGFEVPYPVVGNFGKDGGNMLETAQLVRFPGLGFKPVEWIPDGKPVGVIALQIPQQQCVDRLEAAIDPICFVQQHLPQPLELIKALNEKEKGFIVQMPDAGESLVENRYKTIEPGTRVVDDLLKKQHEIVDSFDLDDRPLWPH